MRSIDYVKIRLREYIEDHEKYEFPEFLKIIRHANGITRPEIDRDLGINKMKMYFLESGQFSRLPSLDNIIRLAKYFNVPEELLIEKAEEYIYAKSKKKKSKYPRLQRAA